MEQLLIVVLLSFLAILTLGIIYLKDLLTAIILLGIYTLVAAAIFVVMDAVDVAFTEAAVGAGISTILLLGTLSFIKNNKKDIQIKKPSAKDHLENSRFKKSHNIFSAVVVCCVGALLIYGTLDLPNYGSADAPANKHPELAQHFITKSGGEIGIPNVVTSVLASYRGYDTLGETVVVFTAAIAVLSLLGLRRRKREGEPEWERKLQKRQQTEEGEK